MVRLFDKKFAKLWPWFLIQTAMAAVCIYLTSIIFGKDKIVIISSLAATAFICFMMPKANTAQTIRVIGGHLVGLGCGWLFSITHLPMAFEYAMAVGLATFLMVLLNVEHPPAAGTALAVTVNEVSFGLAIGVMLSVLIITQMRYIMRNHLKDLV